MCQVPPGLANGGAYLEDTLIEYFCTGLYNPEGEAAISPLAPDIDWSLSDADALRALTELLRRP
jgi:dTDP-4-dehydrorhamnose 3,5-epimerase-like enzyme